MTPQDIDLLATSLTDLAFDDVAADFYGRLFATHPELRSLFPADTAALQRKFADELRAIVDAVTDLDRFVARTRDLGHRHVAYGVTTPDYGTVGEVLLDVLATRWPESPETVRAWEAAYAMVAEAMLEGADANPFAADPAGA